jgi:hypothetical protein
MLAKRIHGRISPLKLHGTVFVVMQHVKPMISNIAGGLVRIPRSAYWQYLVTHKVINVTPITLKPTKRTMEPLVIEYAQYNETFIKSPIASTGKAYDERWVALKEKKVKQKEQAAKMRLGKVK